MTGVRRRGYLAAAVAMMGAALVAALLAAPDKPVDIRLVAPPPPPPETITATATTTVSAVGPVAVTTPAPPPPPPVAAKPLPRQKPAPTSPAPTTTTRSRDVLDFLRCDYKYFDDDDFERCLPWPLTPKELCEYVKDHHLIDVRDRKGRELDELDFDCD